MTTTTAAELTRQGIAAQRAGERDRAADLLRQATEADPSYEMAWLWRSSVAQTDAEKRAHLEAALRANPASEPAKRGMAQLGPAAVDVPPELAVSAASPIEAQHVASVPPAVPKKRPGVIAYALVTLGFLAVCSLLWFGLFVSGPPVEGSEGRIVIDTNTTLAAHDRATFESLRRLPVEEIARLVDQGKVVQVARGTRVKMIEIDGTRSHVQFLDGEHAGTDGWVATTFVGH